MIDADGTRYRYMTKAEAEGFFLHFDDDGQDGWSEDDEQGNLLQECKWPIDRPDLAMHTVTWRGVMRRWRERQDVQSRPAGPGRGTARPRARRSHRTTRTSRGSPSSDDGGGDPEPVGPSPRRRAGL